VRKRLISQVNSQHAPSVVRRFASVARPAIFGSLGACYRHIEQGWWMLLVAFDAPCHARRFYGPSTLLLEDLLQQLSIW